MAETTADSKDSNQAIALQGATEKKKPKRSILDRITDWLMKPRKKWKWFFKLVKLLIPGYSWTWSIAIGIFFSVSHTLVDNTNNFFNGLVTKGFGVFNVHNADLYTMAVWAGIFGLGLISLLQSKMKDKELADIRAKRQEEADLKIKEIKEDYSKKLESAISTLNTATGEVKSAVVDVKSTLYNTPNPSIFEDYQVILYDILVDFQKLRNYLKDDKSNDEKEAIYIRSFESILKSICRLARRFSAKDVPYEYGANLMVYLHKDGSLITKEKLESLKKSSDWVYLKDNDVDEFRGVLVSVDKLIVHSDVEKSMRKVPCIIMPVLGQEDKKKVIPGACEAALGKTNSIVVNNVLDEQYYGEIVKGNGFIFFNGVGSSIRSLVSIHIPTSGEPKFGEISGVLNIDCNKESLLGIESKYAATFICLLRPISYLLARDFEEFLQIYKAKNP